MDRRPRGDVPVRGGALRPTTQSRGKAFSVDKSVSIIGTRGFPSFYGGFETAVRKIAPYLADEGWDVTVYGRKGSTVANTDTRISTPVTRGIEKKSVSTLSYGLTATLHAVRKRPDVVLVMNVANGFFLPLLKARGIPTLVNVDGIEWDRAKWGRVAKWVFHTGARLTAKYADRLVFDSKEIGARWNNEFGRDGDFIPYGGDVPSPSTVEPGLKHRGYVLVVARFVPENSIPEFLEAAVEIAHSYPVVIVGSTGYGGDLDAAAEKLSQEYPNVTWLGHVSDDDRLLALWEHSGVYFHGHSVGGTNPALVQAMACGAPIVARDTIYNREVLSDSGAFTEPTPGAISVAVHKVMSDPELQSNLSSLALARSSQKYTWELVCGSYEKSLAGLIPREDGQL
jgi:glycosyltransferase involved in cell wall biosynthesis